MRRDFLETSSFTLLVVSFVFLVWLPVNSASGDIVLTERDSDVLFDVLAGVGPELDGFHFDPPPFTTLYGVYSEDLGYSANAAYNDGNIIGEASASGDFDYVDGVLGNSSSLAVDFGSMAIGQISTLGDGLATSSMIGRLRVRFTLTEDTPYSYDLTIDPTSGDSNSSINFMTDTFFPTTIINTDVPGFYSASGILPANNYFLNLNSNGSAVSLEAGDEPPFATGMNFSLRLGSTSIPEPGSCGLVVFLAVFGALGRRKRR